MGRVVRSPVYRRRVTSSRLEPPTYTTGAHRARRRAPRSETRRPPERYEPYLDGLFTYCLSVLCDHDAATEVLGEVLAISERQYGRCPAGAGKRGAWLYALARWACLRRLGERRGSRPGAHTGRREPGGGLGADTRADVPTAVAERRRRELAALAWPEAAGTTPEQREALELAARHRLGADDVAAVLSMEPLPARELLNSAACEVERTRAALAVVETGNCPAVAQLTGDDQVLLSAALRRELVRHVDDCPRCRRAAERAEAAGPWPGSAASARAARRTSSGTPSWAASTAVLPLVAAPGQRRTPPWRTPRAPVPPPRASAATASPRTRRTAPPAGTGCARGPSPPPSWRPSSPRPCSPSGPRTGARRRPARATAGRRSAPVTPSGAERRGRSERHVRERGQRQEQALRPLRPRQP